MAKPETQSERTRLVVLLVILGVLIVVAAFVLMRGGPLAGAAGRAEQLTYQPHNLPPLAIDQLSATDHASGDGVRNPFTFGAAPTPTPRPVTPRPTEPPRQVTPRPTPTPRLALGSDGTMRPPPPPFNRDYIGHFGPLRLQVAAFRSKQPGADKPDVEVAVGGEILDGIYIVREIGLESVVIGFVVYDRSEDTRVPLAEK
jgi:hypothetical protein